MPDLNTATTAEIHLHVSKINEVNERIKALRSKYLFTVKDQNLASNITRERLIRYSSFSYCKEHDKIIDWRHICECPLFTVDGVKPIDWCKPLHDKNKTLI